jgi:hypothetical protein
MNNPNMSSGALAMIAGLGVFVIAVACLVGLAIAIYICWLMVKNYERVPAKYRTMEPGHVWFNLIPCVSLVFNFWVFPGLSKSYKAYFDSKGDTSVWDCGEKLALWYSISCVCCLIPYLGGLIGIAGLVLLIMYLIKANELKNKIPQGAE